MHRIRFQHRGPGGLLLGRGCGTARSIRIRETMNTVDQLYVADYATGQRIGGLVGFKDSGSSISYSFAATNIICNSGSGAYTGGPIDTQATATFRNAMPRARSPMGRAMTCNTSAAWREGAMAGRGTISSHHCCRRSLTYVGGGRLRQRFGMEYEVLLCSWQGAGW